MRLSELCGTLQHHQGSLLEPKLATTSRHHFLFASLTASQKLWWTGVIITCNVQGRTTNTSFDINQRSLVKVSMFVHTSPSETSYIKHHQPPSSIINHHRPPSTLILPNGCLKPPQPMFFFQAALRTSSSWMVMIERLKSSGYLVGWSPRKKKKKKTWES